MQASARYKSVKCVPIYESVSALCSFVFIVSFFRCSGETQNS